MQISIVVSRKTAKKTVMAERFRLPCGATRKHEILWKSCASPLVNRLM